jgi:hypothetical protein
VCSGRDDCALGTRYRRGDGDGLCRCATVARRTASFSSKCGRAPGQAAPRVRERARALQPYVIAHAGTLRAFTRRCRPAPRWCSLAVGELASQPNDPERVSASCRIGSSSLHVWGTAAVVALWLRALCGQLGEYAARSNLANRQDALRRSRGRVRCPGLARHGDTQQSGSGVPASLVCRTRLALVEGPGPTCAVVVLQHLSPVHARTVRHE